MRLVVLWPFVLCIPDGSTSLRLYVAGQGMLLLFAGVEHAACCSMLRAAYTAQQVINCLDMFGTQQENSNQCH